jgi:hypothetical protein
MSDSKSVVSVNPTTPENSYKMGIKTLYCRTWSKMTNQYRVLCGHTMSSDVSVPVLSKQHISTYRQCRKFNKNQCQYMILYVTKKREHNRKNSKPPCTFPANGIRKGSVQKIPRRASAIKEVLTAIDNSIGSSGGITEVTIREQLSISLYLLLVGSSSPCNI